MTLFFIFIILLLVSQGFIILEEETLIILASFVWVDAAGGAIRSALDSALIQKGNIIQEKFVYFLNTKRSLVSGLIASHKNRINLTNTLQIIHNYSINLLLTSIFINYIYSIKNLRANQSKDMVFEKAQNLSQAYLYRRLGYCFNLVHRSGSSISSIISDNQLSSSINYGETSFTKLQKFF
jgi:hypothetical protein